MILLVKIRATGFEPSAESFFLLYIFISTPTPLRASAAARFQPRTHAAFVAATAIAFVAAALHGNENSDLLRTCVFIFLFTSQIFLVIHMLAKKYT